MKIKALLAVLVMATGTTAYAESGSGRFYLGLDAFTVAEAADKWKETASAAINMLVDVTGYDTAAYTMKTTPGIGGRFGVQFPFKNIENANWGASIGYVKGPSSVIKVHAESTLTTQGTYKEEIDTSYMRLLLELAKSFPVGSGTSGNQTRFSIGAGIGAAQGKIESNVTAGGSFVTVLGAPTSTSDSKTWTGLTWEVSPSLIIPSGTTEIELGAKIAGFPKLKESDNFSEFKWNPFGFFAALHF